MYIATVPNRKSPPATLIRESYRENGKVKTRTLANISCLSPQSITILRRSLKGENLVAVQDVFEIIEDGSPAHGHVDAVMTAMRRLGFSKLISSRRSRQRDLIVAMVAARILTPKSKCATTLWWEDTTLPQTLDICDAAEDDLYKAMDWLLERQALIEKKLAARHLENDGLVLYDLTSSSFEGQTCPPEATGHNRDGRKGTLQVNYGLLTNQHGVPVSVSAFKGNTADPKTLLPQVDKMADEFGLEQFVLVGNRRMLTRKQVDALRDMDGPGWIGGLCPEAIKKLVNSGAVQIGFFDERNLFELKHPDFPGERLIACRNPELAHRLAAKRKELIKATVKELDKVRRMVHRGRLRDRKEITRRIHSILKQYKIGKHYRLDFHQEGFVCEINKKALVAEVTAKSNGDQELIEKRLKRYSRHMESISGQLAMVSRMIEKGRLHGQDNIGVRVDKVINNYKVGKHFDLDIRDDDFTFEVNQYRVKAEAALDGIYIIRTSLSRKQMDTETTYASYKQLSLVEQTFRSFKTVDLMVRPIRHRLEDRVRAHILLCMLAYYVQWHMMEAWRSLLYADEEQEAKASRDPVAPAKRYYSAMRKISTRHLDDGSMVHSFRSLLTHLSAIVRATCRCLDGSTFTMVTKYNSKQQKALDLLQKIQP